MKNRIKLIISILFLIVLTSSLVYGGCDTGPVHSEGCATKSNYAGDKVCTLDTNNKGTCQNKPTEEGYCCKPDGSNYKLFASKNVFNSLTRSDCVKGVLSSDGVCSKTGTVFGNFNKERIYGGSDCIEGSYFSNWYSIYNQWFECSEPKSEINLNQDKLRNFNNPNLGFCKQNEYLCGVRSCCEFDGASHNGNYRTSEECTTDEVPCGAIPPKGEIFCCDYNPNLKEEQLFDIETAKRDISCDAGEIICAGGGNSNWEVLDKKKSGESSGFCPFNGPNMYTNYDCISKKCEYNGGYKCSAEDISGASDFYCCSIDGSISSIINNQDLNFYTSLAQNMNFGGYYPGSTTFKTQKCPQEKPILCGLSEVSGGFSNIKCCGGPENSIDINSPIIKQIRNEKEPSFCPVDTLACGVTGTIDNQIDMGITGLLCCPKKQFVVAQEVAPVLIMMDTTIKLEEDSNVSTTSDKWINIIKSIDLEEPMIIEDSNDVDMTWFTEKCYDEIDNDFDQLIDCADDDCDGKQCGSYPGSECIDGECKELICDDGIDNDGIFEVNGDIFVCGDGKCDDIEDNWCTADCPEPIESSGSDPTPTSGGSSTGSEGSYYYDGMDPEDLQRLAERAQRELEPIPLPRPPVINPDGGLINPVPEELIQLEQEKLIPEDLGPGPIIETPNEEELTDVELVEVITEQMETQTQTEVIEGLINVGYTEAEITTAFEELGFTDVQIMATILSLQQAPEMKNIVRNFAGQAVGQEWEMNYGNTLTENVQVKEGLINTNDLGLDKEKFQIVGEFQDYQNPLIIVESIDPIYKAKSNDTDCADSDCDLKPCGDGSVCINNECVRAEYKAPEAKTMKKSIKDKIKTFENFLQNLNKGVVITSEGESCDSLCKAQSKTCGFAQAGLKTCSETDSAYCTCY